MIPVSQPSIGQAEIDLVLQALRSNQLSSGPMVRRFEEEFALLHRVKYAVACTSGTTALHLALAAAGIGPGDEVIIPDLSYVATANAVLYTGATPILCDVEPFSLGIDVGRAEDLVSTRTKAILPVHLYGCAAPLNDVARFAKRHNLIVIEDAAEGLGGFYGARRLGACGHMGCFSFYGNKIITTGEGGMVITDDEDLYRQLKSLRGMAQDPDRRFFHTECGFNYRMTDLQAAVGIAQLSRLEYFEDVRRLLWDEYEGLLEGHVRVPYACAPWLFTCLLFNANRDAVMKGMADRGIETRPVFTPFHLMPWLNTYQRPPSDFPVAEGAWRCGISLPTFADMTLETVRFVADALLTILYTPE